MTAPLSRLTAALHRRVEDQLGRGEKVLWAGMPSPARAALLTLPIFIFGVAWASFAFMWEGVAVAMAWHALFETPPPGKPQVPLAIALVFPIFGVPFVLIGIGLLAAPAYAWFRSTRTAHVVTSERILTVSGWPFASVESRRARDVTAIKRRGRDGGRGGLVITFGTRRDSEGDVVSDTECWAGCPDARGAEDAIRAAMEAPRRA